MKRALGDDLDSILENDFLDTLLSEDPKKLRAQGGVPQLCEQICDSFFDPACAFDLFEPICDSVSQTQASTAMASSGSSCEAAREGQDGSATDWQWLSWLPSNEECPINRDVDTRTTGRAAPEALKAVPPSTRGRGRASSKNPSASTLAQRRYQERQKAKRLEEEKKLAELTEQMEQLLSEKKELEVKNRILQRDLTSWQDHLEEMWGNKAIRSIQQMNVLQLTADVMGRAAGRSIPLEEAQKWTFGEYIDVHFKKFMDRLLELSQVALQNPESEEHVELCCLAEDYKDLDVKGGLSSCFHWGCISYNLAETAKLQDLPDAAFWARIADGMLLTAAQIEQVLGCQQRQVSMLNLIAEERNDKILPQLGFEATHTFQEDKMHKCPAANALYQSYRAEQTCVLGFLMLLDRVLSTAQRAYVDAASYPWCPEWMQICGVLRSRRGLPPLQFPVYQDRRMQLPILPSITAFEVLERPMTAYGIGMRMRYGVSLCPFETVLSGYCFPQAPPERLKSMTVLDVMLGTWRELTCWEWMQKVRKLDRLVPNGVAVDNQQGSCGIHYRL